MFDDIPRDMPRDAWGTGRRQFMRRRLFVALTKLIAVSLVVFLVYTAAAPVYVSITAYPGAMRDPNVFTTPPWAGYVVDDMATYNIYACYSETYGQDIPHVRLRGWRWYTMDWTHPFTYRPFAYPPDCPGR